MRPPYRIPRKNVRFVGPPERVHGERTKNPKWLERRRLTPGEAVDVVKDARKAISDRRRPMEERLEALYHSTALLADMAVKRQNEVMGGEASKRPQPNWSDHYSEGLMQFTENFIPEGGRDSFWKKVIDGHHAEDKILLREAMG